MDDNTNLRESLIAQADSAFLVLADQIDDLLDAATSWEDERPGRITTKTVKATELSGAVREMANLLRQLAREIECWKKEEDRVLSKLGVELQILNELYSNIEATMLFLIREDVRLSRFSLSLAKRAIVELVRCNKLL